MLDALLRAVGLAAPTRESGAPRGACRCFRARARQVPTGARR